MPIDGIMVVVVLSINGTSLIQFRATRGTQVQHTRDARVSISKQGAFFVWYVRMIFPSM
jgi:hypothetical protein